MFVHTVRLLFLGLLLRLAVYLFRHNHLFRQLCRLAYVCAMMDDSTSNKLSVQAGTHHEI